MQNRFHACATCIYFNIEKRETGIKYFCSRLGYETHPKHQFNCWKPKDQVQKLMKKSNKK